MPSPFTRRFVVEVTVTEVTPAHEGDESRIPKEPPMSGKKEVPEDSMPPDTKSQTRKPEQGDRSGKQDKGPVLPLEGNEFTADDYRKAVQLLSAPLPTVKLAGT